MFYNVDKFSITLPSRVGRGIEKWIILSIHVKNSILWQRIKKIDLGEDVAQGNYINLAIIAHSVSEFIIDFATVLPGVPKAKVKSRVILTPEHAKRLLLSLQENITRYESNVGKIEIPAPQRHSPGDFPLGGGPKIGEA